MPELGRFISLMNAQLLDSHSRLFVDSVSKSTVSFAADATVVRLVLKNENCLKHLNSSPKLANPLFLTAVCKVWSVWL